MWENFRNVTAIGGSWGDQQIEDEDRIFQKNLRSTELEKCSQYKLWHQHGEMVFMTPKTNVHVKLLGTKPGENLACRKSLIGHSSPTVPIVHNTGLKLYELYGFEQKLSNCNRHGKTFTDFQSLQKHAKTNPKEKAYGYKQCGISYSDCTEGSNNEEKAFVYKQDVRAFSIYNYVQIQERNPSKGNTYICIQHKKCLYSYQDIHKHESALTGTKSYIYNHSWKSLNSSTSFGKHERSHTGEKLCVCKQCGKSFQTQRHRQRHERIHTMEKPCVCKQCGKAFRTHSYCLIHERNHSGGKHYVCKQCGKGFSTLSICKSHERTHSRGRPYVFIVKHMK
ncbi:zinc finger protein 709-like [Octodon degus]|uniref:Zinc finger protein 709-like n=1 Tax=Octodon degus TaxID=10160 RepID=A0A6P6DP29_OCTDE|nr:zinc finger protein 709-like [Octodon degus]